MNIKKASILFTAAMIAYGHHALAASDSSEYRSADMILVELKTEQNRVNAMTRDRKYADLQELNADIKGAMKATIADFHDHLTYCPVYFFIDTNAEKVKNKEFNGILLNADMTAATNITLPPGSTNYYIVYYGYPNAKRASKRPAPVESRSPGSGLVLLNDKFQQQNYSATLEYGEMSRRRAKKTKYAYVSKHFDIKYMPMSRRFNLWLEGSYSFGHVGG